MRAELERHRAHLLRYGLLEIRILRVKRAAHREVLPDKDAVPVAQIKERMILVDVAAPASQHVAVQILGDREGTLKMLGVTAMESVHRSPVAAVSIDFLAVHNEAETTRRGLGGRGSHVKSDCSDTYAFPVRVHLPAILVKDPECGVVQGGIPVAPRPPEVHIAQPEHLPRGVRGDLL